MSDLQESRAVRLLAVLVLMFVPLSFAYNGVLSNARPSVKNDFTSYYVAGLAVRAGMPDALYYPDPVGSLFAQASEQHPWIDLARPAGIEQPNYYLYPPLFAVLFAPLTLLPYKVAYVAWIAFGAVCLAVSVALILRRLPPPFTSSRTLTAAAVCVTLAGLFYPVSRTLAVGQSSLLLLLLLTAVLAGLERRTRRGDAVAGLCLAFGIMLKLTPAIFLPWLVMRRRWRALGACAAGLAALGAASLAAVGSGPHATYFFGIVGQISGGTAFYPNQSLAGLFARVWGGNMRLADLVDPASPAAVAARVAGFLLIAATFAFLWRRPGREDREFSLLVMAGLLSSPISWEHHYTLALIPAWILTQEAATGSLSVRRAALAGGALALVGSYIGLRQIEAFGGGMAGQAAASACLAGGSVLWAVLMLPDVSKRERGGAGAVPSALLALLVVFVGAGFLFKVFEYNRSYRYGDFTSYYVAAATLLDEDGGPLYYPDTPDRILARAETPSPWTETAARWHVPDANYYLYPPFFAIAMIPLALVPYATAHNLWYVVNLLALGGFVWLYLWARGAGNGGLTRAERAMPVVLIALSWPSLFTFGAGQANFVVLLLLAGALEALRRGKEIPAGLMMAGAAAVKLTPVLLLVYLAWRGRYRALTAAAACLATLVMAGGLVAGWGSYFVYAREMVPLLSQGSPHWINESFAGFFTRLVDAPDIFSWALASPSLGTQVLTKAASLALVGAAFLLIGRPGRSSEAIDLEFSLLVVTTLFVSPISWTHHSVLSLLAFLLATRWLVAHGQVTRGMTLLLGLSFVLVNVYVKPPGLFEHGLLRVLASYNLAGNLLLWGLLAALLTRRRLEAPGVAVAAA